MVSYTNDTFGRALSRTLGRALGSTSIRFVGGHCRTEIDQYIILRVAGMVSHTNDTFGRALSRALSSTSIRFVGGHCRTEIDQYTIVVWQLWHHIQTMHLTTSKIIGHDE
jgi:hypothetical protein